MVVANLQEISRDDKGYLNNLSDWNEDIASLIAAEEDLQLTAAHWELIYFLKDFYQQYQLSPAMRPLIKAMKTHFPTEKANSSYLFRLFPQGAKQVSKLAGLPKPTHCL